MSEKLFDEIKEQYQKDAIVCRVVNFSDGSPSIVFIRDLIGDSYTIAEQPKDKVLEKLLGHAYATGYTAGESNIRLGQYDQNRYTTYPRIELTIHEFENKAELARDLLPKIGALEPSQNDLSESDVKFLETRLTHLLTK